MDGWGGDTGGRDFASYELPAFKGRGAATLLDGLHGRDVPTHGAAPAASGPSPRVEGAAPRGV